MTQISLKFICFAALRLDKTRVKQIKNEWKIVHIATTWWLGIDYISNRSCFYVQLQPRNTVVAVMSVQIKSDPATPAPNCRQLLSASWVA